MSYIKSVVHHFHFFGIITGSLQFSPLSKCTGSSERKFAKRSLFIFCKIQRLERVR